MLKNYSSPKITELSKRKTEVMKKIYKGLGILLHALWSLGLIEVAGMYLFYLRS